MGDRMNFIFTSRSLVIQFAELAISSLSKDNIGDLLPILSKNIDIVKNFSHEGFEKLVTLVDCAVLENDQYSGLTGTIALKYMQTHSKILLNIPKFIPNVSEFLVDDILKGRYWENMSVEQLATVQSVFKTPFQHSLYSEMVLAWIIEKKPEQNVVDYITQSLMLCHFDADYVDMLEDKYGKLDYSLPICWPSYSQNMYEKEKPNHKIIAGYHQELDESGFKVPIHVICNEKEPCMEILHHDIEFCNTSSQRTQWKWYSDSPPTEVLSICPCNTPVNDDNADTGELFLYGRTLYEKDHIPFHTSDVTTVLRTVTSDTFYKMELGYIHFSNPAENEQ